MLTICYWHFLFKGSYSDAVGPCWEDSVSLVDLSYRIRARRRSRSYFCLGLRQAILFSRRAEEIILIFLAFGRCSPLYNIYVNGRRGCEYGIQNSRFMQAVVLMILIAGKDVQFFFSSLETIIYSRTGKLIFPLRVVIFCPFSTINSSQKNPSTYSTLVSYTMLSSSFHQLMQSLHVDLNIE